MVKKTKNLRQMDEVVTIKKKRLHRTYMGRKYKVPLLQSQIMRPMVASEMGV
jgi:hypothetical protein